MSILGTFKNMFSGAQAQAEAAPAPIKVDATLAPGSRVHHEYFVGDAADVVDLRWPWTARVYADNGAVNEQEGRADSHELARNAALTWCARIKASLGGEA